MLIDIDMTEKKRIFFNVVATYGRSLYVLILGLFCGRWVFLALGEIDYGLMGLVGGLTSFVSFLNTILSGSICRFYAVSVGASKRKGNEAKGLEECRKWFNTAISVHTVVPVVLVVLGYPIGVYVVKHFLTIPPDRVTACVWVWRFTCTTCFVSMICAPFRAMYTAKQEIAELTLYSFASITINTLFMYYVITHPGVWLVKLAAWTCFITVSPELIIAARAFCVYPECKLNKRYLYLPEKLMELIKYTWAKFWARFSSLIAVQGQAILVNKYMGPYYNSSMTIGNRIAGHASTLSGSLSNAFAPAISSKAGEEDTNAVMRMGFATCRFGATLVLLFAIPLCIEIREILRLWLVTPPAFASVMCVTILVGIFLDHLTDGYAMAIYGTGNGVMQYSWLVGWTGISSVLVAWLLFALGCGMISVAVGIIVSKVLTVVIRVGLGRRLVGFSAWHWLLKILLPISLVACVTMIIGMLPRLFLEPSILRIMSSSCLCEVVFIPLVCLFVLEKAERCAVKSKMHALYVKFKHCAK